LLSLNLKKTSSKKKELQIVIKTPSHNTQSPSSFTSLRESRSRSLADTSPRKHDSTNSKKKKAIIAGQKIQIKERIKNLSKSNEEDNFMKKVREINNPKKNIVPARKTTEAKPSKEKTVHNISSSLTPSRSPSRSPNKEESLKTRTKNFPKKIKSRANTSSRSNTKSSKSAKKTAVPPHKDRVIKKQTLVPVVKKEKQEFEFENYIIKEEPVEAKQIAPLEIAKKKPTIDSKNDKKPREKTPSDDESSLFGDSESEKTPVHIPIRKAVKTKTRSENDADENKEQQQIEEEEKIIKEEDASKNEKPEHRSPSKEIKMIKKPYRHQLGYKVDTVGISQEISKIIKRIEEKRRLSQSPAPAKESKSEKKQPKSKKEDAATTKEKKK